MGLTRKACYSDMTLKQLLDYARSKRTESYGYCAPPGAGNYSLGYLNGVSDCKMQADIETEDRVARLAEYLHVQSNVNSESPLVVADRPYWVYKARDILDPE